MIVKKFDKLDIAIKLLNVQIMSIIHKFIIYYFKIGKTTLMFYFKHKFTHIFWKIEWICLYISRAEPVKYVYCCNNVV